MEPGIDFALLSVSFQISRCWSEKMRAVASCIRERVAVEPESDGEHGGDDLDAVLQERTVRLKFFFPDFRKLGRRSRVRSQHQIVKRTEYSETTTYLFGDHVRHVLLGELACVRRRFAHPPEKLMEKRTSAHSIQCLD